MTPTDIKPFTKEDLEKADVQLLRDGRWGNARVSVANVNGERWTIKDFSNRHWLVKNSFAKFVLWRELKAVRKLHGLEGVPTEAFMVTPHMLAIEYIPGRVLNRVPKEEVSPAFLEECEEIIRSIHARHLVHLDTRGTSNWVMQVNGKPALIDFQASVDTQGLPKKFVLLWKTWISAVFIRSGRSIARMRWANFAKRKTSALPNLESFGFCADTSA